MDAMNKLFFWRSWCVAGWVAFAVAWSFGFGGSFHLEHVTADVAVPVVRRLGTLVGEIF